MAASLSRTKPWGSAARRASLAALLASLLLSAVGCSWFILSYYDAATEKSLTELKPEVASLYASFTRDTVDTAMVTAVGLRLDRMVKHEYSKGKKNKSTAVQMDTLRAMYKRHVEDRLQSGAWSVVHKDNKLVNITEAIDVAIATERQKNRCCLCR